MNSEKAVFGHVTSLGQRKNLKRLGPRVESHLSCSNPSCMETRMFFFVSRSDLSTR